MCVSVVIVSYDKSPYHRSLTENAIKSCIESEDHVEIIVVETNPKAKPYEQSTTLYWEKEFNYNACLNFARKHCHSKYIAFCNNDLIFEKAWASNLIHAIQKYGLLSVCPYSRTSYLRHPVGNHAYMGSDVHRTVLGWCIFVDKGIFSIIGDFDESVAFWCSDDLYAKQLRDYKIKHALVCNAFVNHIDGGSKTLSTETMESKKNKYKLTYQQFFKMKHEKKLSILIPTLPTRYYYLQRLKRVLLPQLTDDVELLELSDCGESTIGEKRDVLIRRASGEYVVFIDDGDLISNDYISLVLDAIETKADVINFLMHLYENNGFKGICRSSIKYERKNIWNTMGYVNYYRRPGHLTPHKREYALITGCKSMNYWEDEDYASRILPLLKTEFEIEKVIYFYLKEKKR